MANNTLQQKRFRTSTDLFIGLYLLADDAVTTQRLQLLLFGWWFFGGESPRLAACLQRRQGLFSLETLESSFASSLHILLSKVTRLHYWQGNGLAIRKSRVRVLAGHHCVVALGKLLTPVCLCHQAVWFRTDQEGWWECNCGPGGK